MKDRQITFEVADRVVVMRGGRIEQEGSPQEVFDFMIHANTNHERCSELRLKPGSHGLRCSQAIARVSSRLFQLNLDQSRRV